MVANKDLKRLVRARMKKTGESYTAARAKVVAKRKVGTVGTVGAVRTDSVPTVPPSSLSSLASLAGISDQAIEAGTGCNWDKWVRTLDHRNAHEWPHSEIAQFVRETFKVSDWWAQTVTVGYERIKGLRQKGQRRDGAFEASRSKVFAVPLARLFRAWKDRRTRQLWLSGVDLRIRAATTNRSMRITWPDQTSVDLWFTDKGKSKCQVQVQHRKLPDKQTAERMKRYWTERLAALESVLE